MTEQPYYRWRKECGGMRVKQAKRLKELEKENTRLKKLVADQPLELLTREGARLVLTVAIAMGIAGGG